MSFDKVQEQRFELKYLINEQKAQNVRHFIKNYLDADEYGITQPQNSYSVHSLYLDSSNLKTYQDTINGNRNRFKIRIRHYGGEDQESVYLEMKRRYDRVITKARAKVPVKKLEEIIYGPLPTMDHLVNQTEEQLRSLQQICRMIREINARPQIHVAYLREAYELEESNAVRITFDRDVTASYTNSLSLRAEQDNPVNVFGKTVILELKFTNRYPHWMNELTQLFHLRLESAAKYVDGVNVLKRKKKIA
ncbi:polyphosphate polymerase domain-containing protein [Gracilimonas mengyeensis]|uniref:VTC domain-containing protein n=1 Tax=Gracilimonas mengyeensis TaxID=1302730 RepID=A0A521BK06_9BACT|nr:polyphosphate polymerase domain-containing protein [Gracilimonas mengyeensis]SMO47429.1 VTC domain-containing protein [Gracilimonas mengyeensis]